MHGRQNIKKILVIVQRDATRSSLFIILQFHSTCFGCQPHPSSGVHKTVTTAFGTAWQAVSKPVWHIPLLCVQC